MTLRDACLQALSVIKSPATSADVLDYIKVQSLFDFGISKYPLNTVSATLGNFVRAGDTRVDRVGNPDGSFSYFLAKDAPEFILPQSADIATNSTPGPRNYLERSLHRLLSTFLSSDNIKARTIFHEQSNSKDLNQTWVHPDMVGIKFLELKSPGTRSLVHTINKRAILTLYSYELKREIHNDASLKQAYFQAVSNSSWANQGYLVALEFSNNLRDEMERLNQSFGIGIIKLSPYPFESKILFPATVREIDYKTVDKLCHLNPKFNEWIDDIDKYITVDDRYKSTVQVEFERKSDLIFASDDEVESYCETNYIPITRKKIETLEA